MYFQQMETVFRCGKIVLNFAPPSLGKKGR
jgi:hypothetical protein